MRDFARRRARLASYFASPRYFEFFKHKTDSCFKCLKFKAFAFLDVQMSL